MKKVQQTIVTWSFPLTPVDHDLRVMISTPQSYPIDPTKDRRAIGELVISSIPWRVEGQDGRWACVKMKGQTSKGKELNSVDLLGDSSGPFCFEDILEADKEGNYLTRLSRGFQFTDDAIVIAREIFGRLQVYMPNKLIESQFDYILSQFAIVQNTWVMMKLPDASGLVRQTWRPLEDIVRRRHGLLRT